MFPVGKSYVIGFLFLYSNKHTFIIVLPCDKNRETKENQKVVGTKIHRNGSKTNCLLLDC